MRLVHIYHSEGHDIAALSGVDFHAAAGEFVGLLGPSGAGKSTLLSLLAGLFRPSAGRILLGTTEISTIQPRTLARLRANEISLMLQGAHRNLISYYSPRQNVEFAQYAARKNGKQLLSVAEVLAIVGLSAQSESSLRSLTPGCLQLSALAMAVAKSPSLLLVDEPTSQLDHRARDAVVQTLVRINQTLGTTVVLVTHDPDVASSLPRTVTIRDGRVGGEGRSGEEYSVVTEDSSLPLPLHVRDDLPPGTLVRFDRVEDRYTLLASHFGREDEEDAP